MAETRPLRRVLSARLVEGRGSVLGPDTSRRTCWWDMTLDCEHRVERTARYGPHRDGRQRSRGGTQHRSRADVLPAPHRARCDTCPQDTR